MPGSAATRSAGRLHPRNRAPSLSRVFYVLLFVVALLGASAVIYGTPWAASASKPQCNNRIDDDGDDKIDYPTDPGCTGRGDKSEVDPPPPPPPPPPLDVTLQAVDGGPNYLQQFTNPHPAGQFPIGVWLQCVSDDGRLTSDLAVGINTWVGLCRDSFASYQRAAEAGNVILQGEWLDGVIPGPFPDANAYMGTDEIDMTGGPNGCQTLQNEKDNAPLGGRYFHNNFGKGVAYWMNDATAACYVNFPDVPSIDLYWMTDENACGTGEGGNLSGVVKVPSAATADACKVPANYGLSVQRVRNRLTVPGSRPIWNFVELGRPWGEANREAIPLPSIRAAAWHSIIAGAMGIEYFAHSFQPPPGCPATADTHRTCPAVKAAVTALSAEIQGLSGVLFSPSLSSGFTASGNVRARAKWDGHNFYVLAGNATATAQTGSFSISCVGDATATVVGEGRTVPVSAGAWSDLFQDMNAVHIYRIDGGSTCGLGT